MHAFPAVRRVVRLAGPGGGHRLRLRNLQDVCVPLCCAEVGGLFGSVGVALRPRCRLSAGVRPCGSVGVSPARFGAWGVCRLAGRRASWRPCRALRSGRGRLGADRGPHCGEMGTHRIGCCSVWGRFGCLVGGWLWPDGVFCFFDPSRPSRFATQNRFSTAVRYRSDL